MSLYTFTSFSGADMQAHIGAEKIGTLTGLSFSVTREKGPVYVAGNADAIGVGRGRRGIAGSLTFAMLDEAALHNVMKANLYTAKGGATTDPSNPTISGDPGSLVITGSQLAYPIYVDQIPPFNVTVTFINEVGQAAKMALYGVDILSEGGGFSIEELTLETQMTFIALQMRRLVSMDKLPSIGTIE